jgi:RNA polymerase sigma factor (TIGR02999 family)
MGGEPTQVTRLLEAVNAGEDGAWGDLVSLLYDSLRRQAHRLMRAERPGHTLQATALVHEAWFKLVGDGHTRWENQAHFFGAAADAMRRILVDHARRHRAVKRGGNARSVPLDEERDSAAMIAVPDEAISDLEALDTALAKMEAIERHSQKSAIVKLRCFGGLTIEETAKVLRKSAATVKRDWTFAKAWLHREMTAGDRP